MAGPANAPRPQPSWPPTPQASIRAFINYASDDSEAAEWLETRLLQTTLATVWRDRKQILGGDRWKQEIDDALWRHQFVLAVVTRTSADPDREWVHYELERAERLLKVVVPCLFEDEGAFHAEGLLPARLKDLDVLPFANREEGFLRLMNALMARLRRAGGVFLNEAAGIRHSFVGRDEELARLKGLIDGETRGPTARKTLAIVGGGGLGKTMLAEELVRRLAFHFPGGVLIENRAGAPRPAGVILQNWAEEVASQMGRTLDRSYQPEEIQSLVGDIRARLSKYGEMLVLIDDVHETDLVETGHLLDALPPDATRIITTRSEDVCRVLGVVRYPLAPMADEDALVLLETRLRERFGAEFPEDGPLDFEEEVAKLRPSLKRLVELVDGHPLALSLGIGTCRVIGQIPDVVDSLAESLERGVGAFGFRLAMTASAKNASLAASLALSLEELERLDRQPAGPGWPAVELVPRFRALGVFPDGASLSEDMILAVWGDTDAPEVGGLAIDGLIGRSMLRAEIRERSAGAFQTYRLHPVVRAYATGLLAEHPEEADEVAHRYERWVIRRADEVYDQPPELWHHHWLLGYHVQYVSERLAATLEEEIGPLAVAGGPDPLDPDQLRRFASADEEHLRLGVELARAINGYVVRTPEWRGGGVRCLRLGLACARLLSDAPLLVEFMKNLGGALAKAQPDAASDYFRGALDAARELGDEGQVGEILSYSGELERARGRPEVAAELLEEALAIHAGSGNAVMEAKTLKYLGEVLWRQSRFDRALELYARASAIYDALDDSWGQADLKNKVGSVWFSRGQHRRAIELFSEALELHVEVGNRSMEGEDQNDMGAAYRYLGESEMALRLFDRALEIHGELGNRRLESIARGNRAGALVDLERYEEALAEAEVAMSVADEVGAPVPLFWAGAWRAKALDALGRPDEAEEGLRVAVEVARGADNPRGLAGVLGLYGALLVRDEARRGEASPLLSEALAIMEEQDLRQAFGGQTREEIEELASRARA